MLQLNPRESFTIVRQIEDPSDATTYYVKAFVRNAKTDALLTTVTLTDRGDRRFSADYSVPADASGNGFWISILTSVYTDSGYTTRSTDYGDKMDTYLVQERYQFNPNYPIPVGPDLDYKRLRKIVEEEVKKIVIPDIPQPKEIDLSEIKKAITDVERRIAIIKFPDIPVPEKINFTPVISKIDSLLEKIDGLPKEIPPYPITDLSPVFTTLKEEVKKLEDKLNNLESYNQESRKMADGDIKKSLENLSGLLKTYESKPIISPIQDRIKKFL